MSESGPLAKDTHLGSGGIEKESLQDQRQAEDVEYQCCPTLASLPPSEADLYPPKRISQSCLFLEIL